MVGLLTMAVIGYFVGDYSIRQAQIKKEMQSQNFISDVGFYDLPRMNITMTSEGGNSAYVRVDVSLKVLKSDVGRLTDYYPRINDRLLTFIRHQDINELRQPVTQKLIRADLLREANKASYPIPIMDIVFRQIVIL